MTVLLALHAVLGLSGVAFGARLGRRGLWLGVLGPLVTVVWLVVTLPGVLDGEVVSETVRWVPGLGIDLDLRLDGFAALGGAGLGDRRSRVRLRRPLLPSRRP